MKQKVFSFSCIPLLAPFAHSNNILYNIPFSCYFNALHIDQQRSTQKLAVLQVHLACCQQLDGQLLNDNNVYPLPSSSFFFFFFPFLSSLSRPLTHLVHAQVMRSGSARGGRKHLDHTQEGRPHRRNESPALRRTLRLTRPCCCCMPEGYEREEGREGVHKKIEREQGTRN